MDSTPINIPEHITQRYRDPARHYHNLDHITHMLNLIPPNHPHERELAYATWFHDCVYDPTAKHGANEKDSIKLWENYVDEQAGEDLKDIKDVVSLMIHCTITHTLPRESPADEVQVDLVGRFLDMDMDILASHRDDYLAYTNKIRQEYAHFPDEAFRKGRAGFLRSEIEKGKVFYLEENEGKNGIAMGNMRAELGMLEN